jgi:hypothetical protein
VFLAGINSDHCSFLRDYALRFAIPGSDRGLAVGRLEPALYQLIRHTLPRPTEGDGHRPAGPFDKKGILAEDNAIAEIERDVQLVRNTLTAVGSTRPRHETGRRTDEFRDTVLVHEF